MSLTLSVVTEKVVISPFRPDGSHIQFPDDGCIAGPLSGSFSIPIFISTYHISSRLLITSPSTFAKWGAFQVSLETMAIPLARLSTFE